MNRLKRALQPRAVRLEATRPYCDLAMHLVNLPYARYGAALAICLPWLGLIGCESNVKEKIALAQLAQNCLVNSDCSAPLVCAFEACHEECVSSRDCEAGARCVAAARPYKVCQLEEERACGRSSDCAEGLICGIDGECRDRCQADTECVEGQVCVSGTCADTNELNDSGQLDPAPGKEQGSEGSPCVYVSDCSAALLCRSQSCLPECKADRDCGEHQACQDTRCVPDGSQPLACSYNSECDAQRGERCLAGNCRCACAEDRDCPSGQACNGCGCEPDPDAPKVCVYNSDCKGAGEICQNRACTCECLADADCGADAKCDGCGCVPAQEPVKGVLSGNVFIQSTLQLAQYRGVTEILGSLTVANSQIQDLGDAFANLRRVRDTVYVTDNPDLKEISFPSLEATGMLLVTAPGKAARISFPKLKNAEVQLSTLLETEEVSFSALETGSFTVYNMGAVKTFSLPAATELSRFVISEAHALESIELPELLKVRGEITFTSQSPTPLKIFSAPKLAVIGATPEMGQLRIDNTQLTSLSQFGAKDWKVAATEVVLIQNPALTTCEADAFVSHLTNDGKYEGPINNSQNGPACPTP